MKLCLFAIYFILSVSALAGDVTGRVIKVIKVIDGDTLTLLASNNAKIKIRLAEIDTPEKAQPYGQEAKQILQNLVFGKKIYAITEAQDRYGRKVSSVYVGDIWINGKLVEKGAAWVYRQYSNNTILIAKEQQAKNKKLGLWALPASKRIPPWQWRKNNKHLNKSQQHSHHTKGKANIYLKPIFHQQLQCQAKHYCKQMSSSEEAKFYLNQCSKSSLDHDHDGLPCEELCK